ncbi:diguanylate cyclase [Serpentinicella alkaliphila]|nr:diguanylate cyclase [Serpentinicella alkaliphila]QUH25480.1 diguanylate cyclase [Serpentinicella alkaliphila]
MLVKKVNGRPAFEIYNKYLNIKSDDQFFLNVLGYSFLVNRQGEYQSRVPISVNNEGAIQFIADIREGETFRIGYADPVTMIHNAHDVHQKMRCFQPQAICLFSCGSRHTLLNDDIDLETEPFQKIAPTFGFYTYGEYSGTMMNLKSLNSTLVIAGFREGGKSHNGCYDKKSNTIEKNEEDDSLILYRDSRAVARLIHFIEVITEEYEELNRQLRLISITDNLTGLFNRGKLDKVIQKEIARALDRDICFSIVIADIDNFKSINDVYGHLAGDAVLVEIGRLFLSVFERESDVIGRWGGEEYLVVLPETSIQKAYRKTEELRNKIEKHIFNGNLRVTCSFGISTYKRGDTVNDLIWRADKALYDAKGSGKNKVIQE